MKFSKFSKTAFYLLGSSSSTTSNSSNLVAAFGSPPLSFIPANKMSYSRTIMSDIINDEHHHQHQQHQQGFRNRMDLKMSLQNNNDNDNDNDDSESNLHGDVATITPLQDASSTTRCVLTKTSSTTNPTTTSRSAAIAAALAKAQALKERAGRERLEAERMSTLLILDKISTLETKLDKLNSKSSSNKEIQRRPSRDESNGNTNTNTNTNIDDVNKARNKKQSQIKQKDEIMEQIAMLQKQLQITTSPSQMNKDGNDNGTKTIDASMVPLVSPKRSLNIDDTTQRTTEISINVDTENIKMPKDLLQKRVNAYKSFSPNVQKLFARAVNLYSESSSASASASYPDEFPDEQAYITAIITKSYQIEQTRILQGTTNSAPMGLLDIANAQAGYETLPPPVQYMVKEMIDLKSCRNNTEIVETLVQKHKVTRTIDGGVEFKMEDPGDDEKDEKNEKKKEVRGQNRDFTKEEVDSALKLYENLPMAMKIMLAQSVGVKSEGNATAVVNRLIEEKKLLPSADGVEFVVFGSGDEMSNLDLEMQMGNTNAQKEGAAYTFIQGILPDVTRKDGQAPTEEDAMEFFRLLGKKTFNPRNKPEKIPGGYVIRGENSFASGEELVKALDAKLKESDVNSTTTRIGDKLYYYYMKDPTVVTQEQFELGDYEKPVIVLTGKDLSPTTNRFVKPVVTALGGFSMASFAVAVCLSTDLNMDVDVMQTMTSPLLFAVLGTQVAHESMHQLVALKDKVCTVACVVLCIFTASSLMIMICSQIHFIIIILL